MRARLSFDKTAEEPMTIVKNIRAVEFTFGGHPARNGDIKQMFTELIRERLKPFVFLDHFDVQTNEEWGFPYHPHSGVATFTYTQTADLRHLDTRWPPGRSRTR